MDKYKYEVEINNYKPHFSSECNSVSNIGPNVPGITTVSNELDKEMLIKLLLKIRRQIIAKIFFYTLKNRLYLLFW